MKTAIRLCTILAIAMIVAVGSVSANGPPTAKNSHWNITMSDDVITPVTSTNEIVTMGWEYPVNIGYELMAYDVDFGFAEIHDRPFALVTTYEVVDLSSYSVRFPETPFISIHDPPNYRGTV